jgi:dTDP-4-amino-4,6-dideoxygalactose transaminase
MDSMLIREIAAAGWLVARNHFGGGRTSWKSETGKFEQELCHTIGVEHALAVNSGTSALIGALVGAGIGPGDEVLVPAYTFVATAAAPLAVGAVPVLVEIDESLTMDPGDLLCKITPHTKAVIPVHMRNLVCDMDAIMKVAADYGLVVVEDACQAVGVRHRGRRVGSIGHVGAFSFNRYKNISSGEGGAILTGDRRIHARATMHHDVGSYDRPGWIETEALFPGMNLRMPGLCAAVLRPQLARIDAQLDRRRERRRMVLDQITSVWKQARPAPHHDEADAVGLALTFDDPAEAKAFAECGAKLGAQRLIDTGSHVYANWRSVLAKRAHHPALDPHKWAHRTIDYSPDSCPATLDILARSCTVDLAPEVPTPAFRLLAAGVARAGKR